MSEQLINTEIETTDKNKVVSLFHFIQELNKLKQKAILNVEKYPWFFLLSNLPNDTDNIKLQYRDRVENEDSAVTSVLLSVRKPEFKKCPEPDSIFINWLEPGWDSYKQEVQLKKTLDSSDEKKQKILGLFDHSEDEKEEQELFSDNDERVHAYEIWMEKRKAWAEKQLIAAATGNLFANLYRLYFELQKESETEEIIVANGMLYDSQNKEIRHPLLTHRVNISYDPELNIIRIEDTDVPSELYSVVFQMLEDINLSAINQLNADLQANDYHPLDRNDTPNFLKVLVHQLSSDSVFAEGEAPENWKVQGRLLLALEPCFIVRRRLDGTLKAIEQIIENVQETGEVPAPIRDIVSGGMIDIPEDLTEVSVEEQLAAVGGESVDILLSKEANKEQLEIARRIERYNAVLVQGPPGTGKTHTIANLLGHFLAQGKSVLVTSYTKKALSVLKEKVAPGLQSLCVSLLDDSNLDMERSIDGITEYMSRTTSFEIKKEMESLAVERKDIIDKLAKVRRNIFDIIHQECGSIVLNGESISPSNAAAFVCDHTRDLSYIPGSVRLHAPLPLSFEQLKDLYRSNESVSVADEEDLLCGIPNPSEILSPTEYEQISSDLQEVKTQINRIKNEKNWKFRFVNDNDSIELKGSFGRLVFPLPNEEVLLELKAYVSSFDSIEKWMKSAAVDGKNGGAFKKRWEMLEEQIRRTAEFAESIITEQFGRSIKLPEENLEPLRSTYSKIRDVIAEKGKLSKLTLLMNKDIEPALAKVSIEGHPVENVNECEIILHCIELDSLRKQCSLYWNDLLTQHGLPEFYSLDENKPESVASNWLPFIDRYLDWYKTDYQRLVDLLKAARIEPDILFSKNALDSDLVFTGKVLDAVENIIPSVCDICLATHRQLEYEKIIDKSKRVLSSGQRQSSKTCRRVIKAINDSDVAGYAAAFSSMEAMFEKYDLQAKRCELLKVLEPFAPQWADAIQKRIGIHGQPVVPETIEEAWKWKQLSGIVAEITEKPYTKLQEDSIRLSREYRETTARYAEKSAWYHLLQRTEANIDMKQALIGWKQTIKKIGKGTGKTAPVLKAKARELMSKCQSAVPVWIMPINRALDSLNPKTNCFDIIIIDEASQSDVSSLAILYMGKKLIIVGDDKQVSPMAVGVEADKMSALEEMYIKDKIPNSHLYNAKTSIYDIAATTFQPLMLREHFRCVPEIIGFSNMLSYDYKIKPLREESSSQILPAVVNYRVSNGRRDGKTNPNEAKAIVALMKACINEPEYAGKTMGVISLLGDDQANLIMQLIGQNIDSREVVKRKILSGNSAHFQGDERDVVFLSVVDSGNGNGPLNLMAYGPEDAYRKRYNVAASRARDQLWVVDSLDPAIDLKPGDIRKMLIEYSLNPQVLEMKNAEVEMRSESPFESGVAKSLVARGYHLVQQWKVGAYRLDMVAVYGKNTVAIECDGERWHSGEAKVREDMERQTILERLGWRFIRIRGSEYYQNKEKTIDRVIRELEEFGIKPEDSDPVSVEGRETDLLQRVKRQAEMELFKVSDVEEGLDLETIATALNSSGFIRNLPPDKSITQPKKADTKTNTSKKEISYGVNSTGFTFSKPIAKTNSSQLNLWEIENEADSKKQTSDDQSQKPKTPSETSESKEKLNEGGLETFKEWFNRKNELTEQEKKKIITSLNTAEMFLKDNISQRLSLFDGSFIERRESIEKLIADPKFKESNEKWNGMYYSAISLLCQSIGIPNLIQNTIQNRDKKPVVSKIQKQNSDISAAAVNTKPDKTTINTDKPVIFEPVDIVDYMKKNRIAFVDKRPQGGCLWMIGDLSIKGTAEYLNTLGYHFVYSPKGSKGTGGKSAWFTTVEPGKKAFKKQQELPKTTAPKQETTNIDNSRRYCLETRAVNYYGATISEAFLRFCEHIAKLYPSKFRKLLDVKYNGQGSVVFTSRKTNEDSLKMMEPEAYIRNNLDASAAINYGKWVCKMCGDNYFPTRVLVIKEK